MQSNNLTIGITADSTKLRADVELMKAALRDAQKAYRDLATEAARTGDRTKLDAATPQLRAMEASLLSLTRQMRQFGQVGAEATHKVELGAFRLIGELTQTTQKMQFLTEAAGSLKGGLAGLLALEFGRRLGEGVSAIVDPMNEVRKTSAALRLDPNVIKAYGAALARAGLQSSDAASSLGGFGNAVLDAQKDVATLRNTLAPSVAVMKGAQGGVDNFASSITTMRAGVRSVASDVVTMRGAITEGLNPIGDAMERIGLKVDAFKNNPIGRLQAIADRVVALGKDIDLVAQRDLMKWLNIDDAQAFLRLMKDIHETPLAGAAAQLPPTDDDQKNLAAYNAEVAKAGNEWTRTKEIIGEALLPFISLETRGAGNFVKGLTIEFGRIGTAATEAWAAASKGFVDAGFLARNQEELDKMQAAWAAFGAWLVDTAWAPLKPGWDELMRNLSDGFSRTLADMQGLWDSFWAGLKSTAQSVAGAIGNAATTPGAIIPGGASGGYVAGPGSGTSDSIMARLSNGEFVMRAAAVSHFGADFMASLNRLRNPFGYAMGGLVTPRLPRFAEGGLVAASAGGVPVHLHIGGNSFALRGDKGIVMGLTREARRASLLSAGRLPGAALS